MKQKYSKEYYQRNKETIKAAVKKYKSKPDVKKHQNEMKRITDAKYRDTPERKAYMKEYWKTYRENNKKSINEYRRDKRNSEPLFKLQTNIRSVISKAINRNGYTKRSNTFKILGCGYDVFKTHIESLFEPWMTWDNYGLYNGECNHGWDIDHIIPLASITTEDDVYSLNYYTNLQPLCSKVNRDIKKGIIADTHDR